MGFTEVSNLTIYFDRSSVCYGDDCESRRSSFSVDDKIELSLLINSFIKKRLALIYGGKATWVIRLKLDDMKYKNIAVVAQQWNNAKLLIKDCRVIELCKDDGIVELFALYRAQEDPDTVYEELKYD